MTHPDPRHPPPDAAPAEPAPAPGQAAGQPASPWPGPEAGQSAPAGAGQPGASWAGQATGPAASPPPGHWGSQPPGHWAGPAAEPWLGVRRIVPRRGELVSAALVAVVLTALGAVVGPLWQWLTPGAEVLITNDGAMHANPHAETYFGDDAVFLLLGVALGVAAAIGCWLFARRHRGPAQLVGMVVGCLLGAALAWQIGRHIGLAEFYQTIEHAKPGETFRRPAKLAAYGVLGVQGFASVFTYTLLAGWSRWPDLRPPPGPAGELEGFVGYPAPANHESPEHRAT